MSKLVIKICGLSTRKTIHAAIEAGADWIGLVSFPPSPRHVTLEEAAQLASEVRGHAKIVSLSVNADDTLMDDIFHHIAPDIVQCHGTESPERISELQLRYKCPVMKAIGIAEFDDLAKIAPYQNIADYILLDAKPPKNARLPGGNGASFDWGLLDHLPPTTEYMLSGGLSHTNVSQAIKASRAFGVDVSSGVEIREGVKDADLIKQFVTATKATSTDDRI